jgi:hypothetical protein
MPQDMYSRQTNLPSNASKVFGSIADDRVVKSHRPIMSATRQTPTDVTTPGVTKRGIRPARVSEDFPPPLAPTIHRNGVPRSAAAHPQLAASSMPITIKPRLPPSGILPVWGDHRIQKR